MKRVTAAGSILLSLGIAALSAAQVPKPGAEVAKLAVWVGTWTGEGETEAGPLGPATRISTRLSSRLVMDGFALESTAEEKAFGGVRWGEVCVYDPVAKNYPCLGYQSDGNFWLAAMTPSGSNWTVTGTWTIQGTAYKVRQERSLSPDGKSWTWKDEISTDGKTWALVGHGKVTKQ